ncbi:Lrp/AsnC family transcriptional regulator [Lacibacterium aquatile]|uniref:Lrp/AsnC family transcriptional regulator n=1 Tax=Lacibacterium aquatile TaxID=1168082 RepID=A0ABW5E0L7_9PROT
MNDIDRKIIETLQADGRAAQALVAEAVGLSVSAVNERVRRLTEAGAFAVKAVPNAKALGFDVTAFLFVLLGKPDDDEPFVAAMAQIGEVQEVHHVTGEWSYLLKVRARSMADLERLMQKRIKTAPGITRSFTMIALSSPKETTALPMDLS